MTLQELKEQGCRVYVTHLRRAIMMDGTIDDCPRHEIEKYGAFTNGRSIFEASVFARGGKTKVKIIDPNGKVYQGMSLCHPNDNYNKSEGIRRAIDKALA